MQGYSSFFFYYFGKAFVGYSEADFFFFFSFTTLIQLNNNFFQIWRRLSEFIVSKNREGRFSVVISGNPRDVTTLTR